MPFIRGVVNFVDSLVKGVKALMWSAEFYPDEEEEAKPSKLEQWIENKFGSDALMKWIIALAVLAGIAFAVVLFIVLPTLGTSALLYFFPEAPMWLRNLLEGVIKLAIFFLYLVLASRLKDIQRTFRYHGAEHKTIFCYEAGLPLTVENARVQSRFHPRCGTSFLFIVIFISILVFSLVRTEGTLARMGLHLLLLPVVVSVSYEIIKWAGRHDNALTRAVSAPGKALQQLTTAEPDDSMLEVAIHALSLVLPAEKGTDTW